MRVGVLGVGDLLSHTAESLSREALERTMAILCEIDYLWRLGGNTPTPLMAIQHAEQAGWTVEQVRGHPWGRMKCPRNNENCRCGEFCIASIWSTPRNPTNHARQIRRIVDGCTALDDE